MSCTKNVEEMSISYHIDMYVCLSLKLRKKCQYLINILTKKTPYTMHVECRGNVNILSY